MEDYEYGQETPSPQKSIKGYQIIILVLAVILAALSFLYYNQMSGLKRDFAIERDTLTNQLLALRGDYDNLRTENDTIARNLGIEREKADSLLQQLAKERSYSRATIRKYEKEIGTLRSVMRNYVHQIDSLNTLNKELITQNADYRQRVTSERLRADMAEEKAEELSTKIRKGSVIRARDIAIRVLSSSDREVTRASRAARLRVDFVLSSNELATPGERNVYARIIGPDGYILANAANAVFEYEGDMISYSATRQIDYQNQDLGVSLYYNGGGITAGKYVVSIYMDGYLIGSTETLLR